jgi:hypothetical protein
MNERIDWVAVARAISAERLSRYQRSASELELAIALYEKNTRLSEAFYTPLQGFEICFRNLLHEALQKQFGANCLLLGRVPLIQDDQARLAATISSLEAPRREAAEGAIIAALNLGFWVKLLGPIYDETLWRVSLYRVFSAQGRHLRRKHVHGRVNAIRRFRNRIAHHEPIWDQDLNMRHTEIIEAISWMCADTALWVERRSHVPSLAASS